MNFKELRSRIGRFYLSRRLVEERPDLIMKLMGKLIIVRAECLFWNDEMEYLALCSDFPVVQEGCKPTEMTINLYEDGDIAFDYPGAPNRFAGIL